MSYFHTDGELNANKKEFNINFSVENKLFENKSAGAPFNVYAPGKYASPGDGTQKDYENLKAWSYAVRPGDDLNAQWPVESFENNFYHLRVYGPNGFFREFSGDKNDPAVSIKLAYEQMTNSAKKFTGNIVLSFKN